jgi:hypothetical protein
MPGVYALLVGIDRYQFVRGLNGCVADVAAIEALLKKRLPADELHLSVIADADASRKGIIDTFRRHLGQARAGDIALFYYCGHGSLESCPPEWARIEPSGMNQTIVPSDARAPGVFDIADKELNALIGEAASGGAAVVAVFDSCHSGGVTRDAEPEDPSVRMTARASVQRTLTDYLDGARELYDPARVAASGPPEPRHIAIAACQPDQTAKEFPVKGQTRGAFSVAFGEAVTTLGPSATYADLVTAIRARVRDRAEDQSPCLYVSGGASGQELFLAGQMGRRDMTVDFEADGWWLSAGTIDGVPGPQDHAVTEVAVYDSGSQPVAKAAPLAHGVVTEVRADRARLAFRPGGAALERSRQYRGVVTRLDRPAIELTIRSTTGDAAALKQVRAALEGHPLFTVVDTPGSGPKVVVEIGAKDVRVIGGDGQELPNLRFDLTEAGIRALAGACVHVARWHGLRDRAAAGSTLNDRVNVEIMRVELGEERAPDDRMPLDPVDRTIAIHYADGQAPRVQIRLRNGSDKRVYAALVDLTDSFACVPLFADWLEPGQLGWISGGKVQRLAIPPWKPADAGSVTDVFKVMAATTDFDAERWRQEPLLGVRDRSAQDKKLGDSRDVADDETPAPARDESFWGASTLTLVTTRN